MITRSARVHIDGFEDKSLLSESLLVLASCMSFWDGITMHGTVRGRA